ncbi:hypothetical protein [Paramagnetospirillum kuznetsovii]|uniref:hypothetical protein n=1 Tax=Paramagnetospirillum kuznetsovii TaxID=2053833 RepID=UPI0011BD7FD6|nr:hypothetical protein [Paramagnetospirillum kuznetsovii]
MYSPIHIAIRSPLSIKLGSKKFNTVGEHNAIVNSCGSVLFAKFGLKPDGKKIKSLSRHVLLNETTNLYLFSRCGDGIIGHFSEISAIYEENPPNEFKHLIPEYYSLIDAPRRLWFLLSREITETPIDRLKLGSSGRGLVEVVSECRTSAMIVKIDE